ARALAHPTEAEEVRRGARMRAARKPSAVARELLRNFPKSGSKRRRRKRKTNGGGAKNGAARKDASAVPRCAQCRGRVRRRLSALRRLAEAEVDLTRAEDGAGSVVAVDQEVADVI